MKTFYLCLFTLLLFACSNSDEGVVDNMGLEGKWTLTNVSCFCGFDENTDFTLTSLTFNTEANEVEVLNEGDLTFFRENGTYTYAGEGNTLSFENGREYTFAIENNTLQLNYVDVPMIADDEISYSFVRD